MAELITIGIFVGIYLISKLRTEIKLDNYPVSKIDNAKLGADVAAGVSVSERRRRCVNGYYDKDK